MTILIVFFVGLAVVMTLAIYRQVQMHKGLHVAIRSIENENEPRRIMPTDAQVYVVGADRNNPDEVRAHLYCVQDSLVTPMCEYGWNRGNGRAFSILRGASSARGVCVLCQSRRDAGLPPITEPRGHKTKWV
mgnify:CR=1 FL=1